MDKQEAVQHWFSVAMEKRAESLNAGNARQFTKSEFLQNVLQRLRKGRGTATE